MTTIDLTNALEGEDIIFWVFNPACICTGRPAHNPHPLTCTGFGNTHKCGQSGIELQGVLRCPKCKPGQKGV